MSKSGAGSRAEAEDAGVDDRVKRWQWFFRTRVGPDGKSLGGFAKRAVRTLRDAALQAAPPAAPGPNGVLNWSPLGPSVVGFGQAAGRPPVSGRITALAVGPDGLRVYAGAANGGVWFSADSGMTWAPLDDFIVSASQVPGVDSNALSVGGLSMRFGQSAAVDDVFVGTGEPGAADFSKLGLPAGHDRVRAAAFVASVNNSDPFTATGTDLDEMVMHDKHVAYRIVKLVAP
jgi:hypothetical protein